jgi:hypothetical protein
VASAAALVHRKVHVQPTNVSASEGAVVVCRAVAKGCTQVEVAVMGLFWPASGGLRSLISGMRGTDTSKIIRWSAARRRGQS